MVDDETLSSKPQFTRPRRRGPTGLRETAHNDDEPPNGRLVMKKPAATYSPGPLRAKYHRRCGA